jgi:hypothetical protein
MQLTHPSSDTIGIVVDTLCGVGGGLMHNRVVVLVIAMSLVGGAASAQTSRLGDVAGKITLDSSALKPSDGGVVDDPSKVRKADHALIGGVLERGVSDASRLAELVDQARRTVTQEGGELWNEMEASALALDESFDGLATLRLTEVFGGVLEASYEAEQSCGLASRAVRRELAERSIAFQESTAAVARCRELLDRCTNLLAQVESGGDGAARSTPGTGVQDRPEEIGPTPEETIAELCAQQGTAGQPGLETCTQQQFLALAALESRSAGRENLDEAVFTGIRQDCRRFFPGDFARQNRCELDRMTRARIAPED